MHCTRSCYDYDDDGDNNYNSSNNNNNINVLNRVFKWHWNGCSCPYY